MTVLGLGSSLLVNNTNNNNNNANDNNKIALKDVTFVYSHPVSVLK